MNDLTQHPDLSTRAYVTGFPHGRFYAGVPITSPSGVNIGAYCILDDQVRDGVSKEELVFLGDMSQTVMTHLETVRALAEREHANRMVAGLGDFVRGASDTGTKATRAATIPRSESSISQKSTRTVQYRLPDALMHSTISSSPSPSPPAAKSLPNTERQPRQGAGSPEAVSYTHLTLPTKRIV